LTFRRNCEDEGISEVDRDAVDLASWASGGEGGDGIVGMKTTRWKMKAQDEYG